MKNMKSKILLVLTFMTGLFVFNSCLKDNVGEYWKDDLAGKMYATVATATLQQMALKPVAGDVSYSFLINIATDALPTEDITVVLGKDDAAVTAYNTAFKKAYKPFPNVQVLTSSIVIKAGTRNATVSAKVWGAETLNACDNFIAAVSIQSATTTSGKVIPIAGNMKTYLLALPIANPYAGNYQVDGYRIRPGNATEPVSQVEAFNTFDCKTVQKTGFGNYSAYDIKIEMTTETVVVGGTTCFKVIATPIDPSSGASVGGMFTTWTGDATLKPDDQTINYYNPVTKTFILNCYYTYSAGNRIMYEKAVRIP